MGNKILVIQYPVRKCYNSGDIYDADGDWIAAGSGDNPNCAAEIVRCLNAYNEVMVQKRIDAQKKRFYYKPTGQGDFVVGDNKTTPSDSFAEDDPMRGLMRPVYFEDEGHAQMHCRFLNMQNEKVAIKRIT